MSQLIAEERQRQEDNKIWFWLLGSLILHILALIAYLTGFWIFPPEVIEEEPPIEFTIVDPSEVEPPPDAQLQASENSQDAGEARPEEDPSAGSPSQEAAPPPAPEPPQPEPPQPEPPPPAPPEPEPPPPAEPPPLPEPEPPPPPPEPEPPPPVQEPEPEPLPVQEDAIAAAPPPPAPTPEPPPTPAPPPATPLPTQPPEPPPPVAAAPPAATPIPFPAAPAEPAPPAESERTTDTSQLAPLPPSDTTRPSDASQLGGPVSTADASGVGGAAANAPVNPTESAEGPPSVAAQANVDWGPYLERLQRRVEANWIPGQSGDSRRTVVEFTIGRGGQLSNLRVARSSGSPDSDAAAIAAINRASPFETLPEAYAGNSVSINFTFDLNVLGGGITAQ